MYETARTVGAAAAALPLFSLFAAAQCPQDTIEGTSPADGDHFGAAIDTHDDLCVIGAPGAGFSGELLVARRSPRMLWETVTEIPTPFPQQLPDDFGDSVAVEGEVIAAGVPSLAVVSTFVDASGTWTKGFPAFHPNALGNSEFGTAVELDGGRLYVGAPNAEKYVGGIGTGIPTGGVFVFDRDDAGTPADPTDDSWIPALAVYPPDDQSGLEFGASIDVENGELAVGAPGYLKVSGPAALTVGAAYVFVGSGLSFEQRVNGNQSNNEAFGTSIAIWGDRMIVGAIGGQSGQFSVSGAAFAFDRNGTSWSLNAILIPANAPDNHRLGADVDLVGDLALVGAPHAQGVPNAQPGKFYAYVNNDGTWDPIRSRTSSSPNDEDLFGTAVALTGRLETGDLALVGAPRAGAIFGLDGEGLVDYRGTTLEACPTSIPAASGGTYTLSLSAGASNAGMAYAVLGSATGTSPGLDLDGNNLPLVYDAYFQATLANGGAFSNFTGNLNANGRATATLTINGDPDLQGGTLYHAYALAEQLYTPPYTFTSHAVALQFE